MNETKISWVSQPYQRIPWLRVPYGRRVLPPNDQSSNLSLADSEVLQRRDEPIGHSFAPSLTTRDEYTGDDHGVRW